MKLLAIPLGYLMKGCYLLVKNYGLSLFLFTLITRIILFPFNVKQQKNAARMSLLQPEIEKLKKKYGKNQEKLSEETMKLYSENNASPMASCLPSVISLILLYAMIPVVYGPLTYISDASDDNISADKAMLKNIYSISTEVAENNTSIEEIIASFESDDESEIIDKLEETLSDPEKYENSSEILTDDDLSASEKQRLLEAFVKYDGLDDFVTDTKNFTSNLMKSSYGPEVLLFNFESKADGKYLEILNTDVQDAITGFDYSFFGMQLGKIPSKSDVTVIIPFISFFLQLATTIVSQFFQRRNNPSMKLGGSMLVMLLALPLLSLWIGFSFPCALGIYWAFSSLIGFVQMLSLNLYFTPERMKATAEKENEKAKAKRKKKGPSFMERALEMKNEQEAANAPTRSSKRVYSEEDDDTSDGGEEDNEEKKLSKAQKKELDRQKLNEARKRYAEKYGDSYDED